MDWKIEKDKIQNDKNFTQLTKYGLKSLKKLEKTRAVCCFAWNFQSGPNPWLTASHIEITRKQAIFWSTMNL